MKFVGNNLMILRSVIVFPSYYIHFRVPSSVVHHTPGGFPSEIIATYSYTAAEFPFVLKTV